jgi:hypothetical protein
VLFIEKNGPLAAAAGVPATASAMAERELRNLIS